jgi:hypothetical protein
MVRPQSVALGCELKVFLGAVVGMNRETLRMRPKVKQAELPVDESCECRVVAPLQPPLHEPRLK